VSDLTRRLTLAVLITVLSASTVSAQHRATYSQDNGPLLGPQLGFATNSLDFFIGGQFSYPVANQFDIYPSFDFFFPGNSVTVWAINAEGRYWPKLSMVNPGLYVGGGLDITHGSGGGGSASRAGLGLLGGWDFKAVSWRPFAQIHIVIGDADRVEFGGGVNFKL
jgi:hypothetical protein